MRNIEDITKLNLFLERTEVLSIPLYKYYGNLDYAKDVIENHRIHFESPKEYNDVYDSATYITDEQILSMYYPKELILNVLGIFASEKEEIEKFNKEFISLYDEMSEICIKDSIEGFVKSFPKYSFKTLLTVFRTVLSLSDIYTTDNPKITCFTENNDSLLMWSYYANSHKGVCLGYKMSPKDRLEFFQLGVKHKLDVFFVNPAITEYKLKFTQCLKDGELLFPKKY